ncbi:MAG TPA: cation diffusion facilitator family transporter [Pseudomonadales bacterium]|jgi:cation diffusion facilitator family transporter|nr:cation diffusion facilitator family transporter [Pseudomonadales bacterium]HMW83568.1 cation diffusion facilitator family transporter [Pseudomonadales bacterium]HMZ71056.1 cation diffusion facilitator family transporter [Pseudomonadales bacterium]HMZ91970.1 cation diffusion facilitator family transporter [Pseudomonadales bacterium]HNB84424.1 cation diffusion facilitator family transporter [Pseudomonadales bacterium]
MPVTRYLWLSIAAAIATLLIKLGAWQLTDSIGYLSDGLESFVNLAGALFALAMVVVARQPADHNHHYGHSKTEYFSVAFEGLLICIAAALIIWSALNRFLHPQPLSNLDWGTLLSLLATAINFAVSRLLSQASRSHHSPALDADARHLMTDVWTTFGVIAGVGLAGLTEAWWLDPLVAIAVAINILREGSKLMRGALDGLMDHALPPPMQARIEQILLGYAAQGVRFGNLRTRAAGHLRFAQVDLFLPGSMTVAEAHDLADQVEQHVFSELGITLSTHVEPAVLDDRID